MESYIPVLIYLGLVALVTVITLALSGIFPSVASSPNKFLPYESGIRTETDLFSRRFPLHHYLVALMFLVFDIEVIFLYPWAVVAQEIGPFAFYEMVAFLLVLLVGYAYVWKKGGLGWE